MAITTSGTTLTFNDATTQTTAPVNTNANVTSATATAGTGISVTGITTTGAATHTITNTGVTSVTGAGTVSVSASTGGVTITGTGGSGTVTSVATGNGLSGGTITTSGTLTVACPTYGSVGSYAFLTDGGATRFTPNSNYSGMKYSGMWMPATCYGPVSYVENGGDYASGTWKALGYTREGNYYTATVFCRVS